MANVDWIKIRNEYINSSISYRKLAEKHNITFQTLRDRALKEKWFESRKIQRHKIGTKTAQKTADKIVEVEVDRLTVLLELTDEAQKQIRVGMSQLGKYMDMFGNAHESEIIDVNKLKKLVTAMKDLKEIIRTDTGNDLRKLDEVLGKIEGNI